MSELVQFQRKVILINVWLTFSELLQPYQPEGQGGGAVSDSVSV